MAKPPLWWPPSLPFDGAGGGGGLPPGVLPVRTPELIERQERKLAQQEFRRQKQAEREDRADPVGEMVAVTGRMSKIVERYERAAYNSALLSNPQAFVALGSPPQNRQVSNGNPILVYENDSTDPVVVYVRAGTTGGTVTGLMLSVSSSDGTETSAPVGIYHTDLDASVILRPNGKLWAAATFAGASAQIIVSVMPLKAKELLFGGAE